MSATTEVRVGLPAGEFSYRHACEVSERIATGRDESVVVVDFESVSDATMLAFARLILLRQELLSSGRDVRLVGLRGRAKARYEIGRLECLLPGTDDVAR